MLNSDFVVFFRTLINIFIVEISDVAERKLIVQRETETTFRITLNIVFSNYFCNFCSLPPLVSFSWGNIANRSTVNMTVKL